MESELYVKGASAVSTIHLLANACGVCHVLQW
jgi:hypothetical protein